MTLHGLERISYMMEKTLEEDFPSYMMEKTPDNALLRWLGKMLATLLVDTDVARRLFNNGHRPR